MSSPVELVYMVPPVRATGEASGRTDPLAPESCTHDVTVEYETLLPAAGQRYACWFRFTVEGVGPTYGDAGRDSFAAACSTAAMLLGWTAAHGGLPLGVDVDRILPPARMRARDQYVPITLDPEGLRTHLLEFLNVDGQLAHAEVPAALRHAARSTE